jgi:hypothetical protein
MATVDQEKQLPEVKVKVKSDLVLEAIIIGMFIYYGLQHAEIKVEVVIDKAKVEQKQSSAPDSSALKRMM